MTTKNKTITQIAKETSFEDIYELIGKYKLEKDIIQNDITALVKKRNQLESAINRENQIALTKRRSIIDKK